MLQQLRVSEQFLTRFLLLAGGLVLICVAAPALHALVPDAVGLTEAEARELLTLSGTPVSVRYGAEGEPGRVVRQTPLGFAPLPPSTPIELIVAGPAPEPAEVPEPAVVPEPAQVPEPADVPLDEPAPLRDPPAVPQPIARPEPVALPDAPALPEPTALPEAAGSEGGFELPGALPGPDEEPAPAREPRSPPRPADDDIPAPPTGPLGPRPTLPATPPRAQPEEPRPPVRSKAPRRPRSTPSPEVTPTPPLTMPGPGATAPRAPLPLDFPFETTPEAEGPELPDTIGRTLSLARRRLRRWRVRIERTLAVASLAGQVVNQRPMPGQKLSEGAPVTLVVAVTETPEGDWRTVPHDIGGTALPEAIAQLEDLGLEVVLRRVRATAAQHGRVVSTLPLPGSLTRPDTKVRVRIGFHEATATAKGGGEPAPTVREQPIREYPLAPPAREGPLPGVLTPIPRSDEGRPPSVALPAPLPEAPGPRPSAAAPIEPESGTQPLDPPPPTPGDAPVPEPEPEPAPTRPQILDAPKLVGPPQNESYPRAFGATFRWDAVEDATEYEWELQEELPSGAWRTVTTRKLSIPKYRPQRMPRGRFRWRVRGLGRVGPGRWSDYRRLYMY